MELGINVVFFHEANQTLDKKYELHRLNVGDVFDSHEGREKKKNESGEKCK